MCSETSTLASGTAPPVMLEHATASERKLPILLLGLLALVLATRLPYFFVDVIDWDESTFILMGHSILDGHLPYDYVWDNKPPLIFTLFATLAALPGDPVLVVRLFAALCVVATASLIYLLGRRIVDPAAGKVAAVLYALGMATSSSGQAATSELISLLPVLAAVWLLAGPNPRVARYVVVGALLSAATLIRLNLGIVVVAIGLWIVAVEYRAGFGRLIAALAAYAAGGLSLLAACAIPYVLSGSLDLFWYSVFEAPFQYATTQRGPLDNLIQHAYNAMGMRIGLHPGRFALGVIGWAAAGFGLLVLARRYLGQAGSSCRLFLLVVFVAAATGISILLSGVAPLHYLIALLPFVAIFAGAAYAYLAQRTSMAVVAAIVLVGGLVMLQETGREYLNLGQRLAGGQGWMHGPSYAIADYLRPACSDRNCSVYLLEDHLAYAILGIYPPRKIVTHPSNISKPSLLSPMIGAEDTPVLEMEKLLASRPEFIVKRDKVWYLYPEQDQVLTEVLQREYQVAQVLGDRSIYRIRRPDGAP